ncbi:glycerate kinase [Halobacteriaceae archaeon GCM10025711]
MIDRTGLADTAAHELALDCVEAGIRAARPDRVVTEAVSLDDGVLEIDGRAYDLAGYDEVVVLGGGKAAAHVAAALETVLGDRIAGGVVVTDDPVATDRVEVLPGDHPVPSERGVESTRRVLDRAAAADEDTLVLAVITGGGSALLAAPADGVSLADLQATTDALLESGATIHEVNAVRKHLSAVKGGHLVRAAAPATVAMVVFSDVVGNDLDVIASGPTVPDTSTFADALDVVDRYDLAMPDAVRDRLEQGARGVVPETPPAGDSAFDRVTSHVLADGFTALDAARTVADERGFETLLLSSRVRGEAREAATTHVAVAEECLATGNPVTPPAVVLSGGETTVTVRGDGEGGPNQEFALSAAIDLPDGVVLASVDTDGVDGTTDAAGALVDGTTVDDVGAARDALAANDAYPYLAARNALVRTGQTGTNVNDLRVVVVAP